MMKLQVLALLVLFVPNGSVKLEVRLEDSETDNMKFVDTDGTTAANIRKVCPTKKKAAFDWSTELESGGCKMLELLDADFATCNAECANNFPVCNAVNYDWNGCEGSSEMDFADLHKNGPKCESHKERCQLVSCQFNTAVTEATWEVDGFTGAGFHYCEEAKASRKRVEFRQRYAQSCPESYPPPNATHTLKGKRVVPWCIEENEEDNGPFESDAGGCDAYKPGSKDAKFCWGDKGKEGNTYDGEIAADVCDVCGDCVMLSKNPPSWSVPHNYYNSVAYDDCMTTNPEACESKRHEQCFAQTFRNSDAFFTPYEYWRGDEQTAQRVEHGEDVSIVDKINKMTSYTRSAKGVMKEQVAEAIERQKADNKAASASNKAERKAASDSLKEKRDTRREAYPAHWDEADDFETRKNSLKTALENKKTAIDNRHEEADAKAAEREEVVIGRRKDNRVKKFGSIDAKKKLNEPVSALKDSLNSMKASMRDAKNSITQERLNKEHAKRSTEELKEIIEAFNTEGVAVADVCENGVFFDAGDKDACQTFAGCCHFDMTSKKCVGRAQVLTCNAETAASVDPSNFDEIAK